LRSSGVPYTIVRPGGLSNAEGGKAELTYSQGDLPKRSPGTVSRTDVAAICVAALAAPAAQNTTFEIVSKPADDIDPGQLDRFFDGLKAKLHDAVE